MKNHFPNTLQKHYRNEHLQSYQKIVWGDRIAVSIPKLFVSHNNFHSEILISLHIREVRYQVQLWINKDHPYADVVMKKAIEQVDFDIVNKDENGVMINCNRLLYQFIEVDNSDLEIKNWFSESLIKIKKLIDSLPELDWEDKLMSKVK